MPKIIDSNGGPLIMLERALLPYWGGIDNIGGVRPQRADKEPLTDYDRACIIRGWIAPLQVLDRSGVVFWGDHLGLRLERASDTVFFAVRIFYEIENLRDQIQFAKKNPSCFKKDFDILMPSGNAIVFDSAFPGAEVRRDYLEIDILPGIYEVLTYAHKAQDAEVVFHKFHLYQGM
jgi:small basic protein